MISKCVFRTCADQKRTTYLYKIFTQGGYCTVYEPLLPPSPMLSTFCINIKENVFSGSSKACFILRLWRSKTAHLSPSPLHHRQPPASEYRNILNCCTTHRAGEQRNEIFLPTTHLIIVEAVIHGVCCVDRY